MDSQRGLVGRIEGSREAVVGVSVVVVFAFAVYVRDGCLLKSAQALLLLLHFAWLRR